MTKLLKYACANQELILGKRIIKMLLTCIIFYNILIKLLVAIKFYNLIQKIKKLFLIKQEYIEY